MTGETRIALGLKAQKGGAVVVGIAVAAGVPRVLLSCRIATASEGDRLAFEPYRVAFEMVRSSDGRASPEAIAAVAEGCSRQSALAEHGLRELARELEAAAGTTPAVVALLVNRAGWITDLLDYSLDWADHVPVAEALAVRQALRQGAAACGLVLVEQDEKSLLDRAAVHFAVPAAAIEAQLKALGATAGKPWRKEQKLACLAAWLAVASA
jgi:hypothetical protein